MHVVFITSTLAAKVSKLFGLEFPNWCQIHVIGDFDVAGQSSASPHQPNEPEGRCPGVC